MATLGVQSVQIGVKRSIGIRRSLLPIDGFTRPTIQIAHFLSALVCMLIIVCNQVIFFDDRSIKPKLVGIEVLKIKVIDKLKRKLAGRFCNFSSLLAFHVGAHCKGYSLAGQHEFREFVVAFAILSLGASGFIGSVQQLPPEFPVAEISCSPEDERGA